MTQAALGQCNTNNKAVLSWVAEMVALCKPDHVHWCDGSNAERQSLTSEAVAKGILIQLNPDKLPGCYYHRSNPNDVARVEQSTFICTKDQEEAGPTNNWMAPREMVPQTARPGRGGNAGADHVCHPLPDGPPGLASHQGRH